MNVTSRIGVRPLTLTRLRARIAALLAAEQQRLAALAAERRQKTNQAHSISTSEVASHDQRRI